MPVEKRLRSHNPALRAGPRATVSNGERRSRTGARFGAKRCGEARATGKIGAMQDGNDLPTRSEAFDGSRLSGCVCGKWKENGVGQRICLGCARAGNRKKPTAARSFGTGTVLTVHCPPFLPENAAHHVAGRSAAGRNFDLLTPFLPSDMRQCSMRPCFPKSHAAAEGFARTPKARWGQDSAQCVASTTLGPGRLLEWLSTTNQTGAHASSAGKGTQHAR